MKIAALAVILTFAACSKVNPPPAPESKDMSAGAGGEKATGKDRWLVRDSGKRCVVAPCPSWVAKNVATGVETEITGVDLSGMKLEESEIVSTRERVLAGKVEATGSIERVEKAGPAGDGTVLFVVELAK